MKIPLFLGLLAALALRVPAQKMENAVGEAPGPWLLGTIGVGKQADGTIKTTALKGLAVKVGEKGEATVCYDLDLCRMAGAWTGRFTTPMNLMSRGEYPTAMGEIAFTTGDVPGFLSEDVPRAKDAKEVDAEPLRPSRPLREASSLSGEEAAWKDPRPEPFGRLPAGQARFRGFYVNGEKTVLKWEIGGVEVLEMPGYKTNDGFSWFERAFILPPHQQRIEISLLELEPFPYGDTSSLSSGFSPTTNDDVFGTDKEFRFGESSLIAGSYGLSMQIRGAAVTTFGRGTIESLGRRVSLIFEPSKDSSRAIAVLWTGPSKATSRFRSAVGASIRDDWKLLRFLGRSEFTQAGPARWPEPVVTKGDLAKQDTASAYLVDTIKLPDPNPWGAPMFTSGLDFFDDGRAAVCTFHGDVFVVSGLDEKLAQVTWRRFASGLYHPLGLKIVKGEIFLTCRDGLWRLNDLNKDGECDFYEAFNFDLKVTKNFHEFTFDLQTDPAGNFYFAKAGPVKNGGRGFDQIMAQHGTLMRVSPEGAKLEVIATGFRAPNGIGVGPHGELTSGDNEGTWTPACKINWIKPGGFYGVVDLAHRTPPPTSYDPPLCWLPKRVDNSGGSQVWAPAGERWGPWGGKMLHLSYGTASLFGVLHEEIPAPANPHLSTSAQGGVTKFPLQFQSGIMRGRFNPVDGQLYVVGLRGWQTVGLKNGAFQRVRYTGKVPRMPLELHVRKGGIELRFACSLDTQSAGDPENWQLEQWRYLWSNAYGSPELSTVGVDEQPTESGKDGRAQFTPTQLQKTQHDPVVVKSVSIGTDERSVFLEIPDLKPTMQMSISYDLKSADGKELRGEVVNTIHALGAE